MIRHAALTRTLVEGIASGRYPVGSLLPTEFELCDLYGASRHTVRIAINELVELGLVSRRKRAGTRVEARTAPGNYRQSLTSLDDLVQFGTSHRRVVRDTGRQVMDPALAHALGCPEGSSWWRISSLRLDGIPGAPPVGWTDVYVDGAYTGIPDLARASPDSLIATLIEQHHGRHVAEIRQDITAAAMPGHLSEVLQAEAGSPALRIVRRYLDHAGEAFEVSDTVHPAGRFTASSRLLRG
ncbi:GntR family transcriptional regulator [Roseomonas gilardii]|uniref:GntR family transcriptional regulator n=1 Tax=Roseomonas gilardii TaxID=257708 RepID=UPI001F3A4344|nr:GntR family transcriptional regulator [Roseomonas gilardii]